MAVEGYDGRFYEEESRGLEFLFAWLSVLGVQKRGRENANLDGPDHLSTLFRQSSF